MILGLEMKMKNEMLDFGRRLAMSRKKYGLTQMELAEKLGIAVETVKYYETQSKNPTLATLQKVSDVFGITIDELLYDKKTHHPGPESRLDKSFRKVRKLSRQRQERVISVIDALTVDK